MPDVAAIDGITGPGRRTIMIQGDVQEVTFKLKKKVIEVVNRDGSYGSYDLAQVTSINVTSDGKDFTLSVLSKLEEDIDGRNEDGREEDRGRKETGDKGTGGGSKGSEFSWPTTGTAKQSQGNPSKPATSKP